MYLKGKVTHPSARHILAMGCFARLVLFLLYLFFVFLYPICSKIFSHVGSLDLSFVNSLNNCVNLLLYGERHETEDSGLDRTGLKTYNR